MFAVNRLCFVPLAAAALLLTACDHNPKEWKIPNMTALTPRLQPIFEKIKTVCFGRFMIEVPASATVAWGMADVPLGVRVYPNGVDEVKGLTQEFIDKLKSEKAINHDDVPLLISIDNLVEPEGKIVTGYENFEAINGLQINGFFRLKNYGFIIESRPLREDADETFALIKGIARRMRQHSEADIPTEPGNCIEHGFLPDEPGQPKEPPAELIRIGFRLKEFPDTHLSIFVGPSNPHYTENDSLEWRLDQLVKEQQAQDPNNPLLKTRYLRKGERQLHDWSGGFEALSRTPEQSGIHSIHDFAMDFRGVPLDPLKPYAEIQMQTGVADNAAGATRASLTDEEAIAVWDKITSTIRVRPTSATPVKTAGDVPCFPLGELAATGRTCLQTGWWASSDTNGAQRQHVKAGERMPHVTLPGEPSIWQKLKGERPSYRTATVWKLVAYDELPAPADIAAEAQTVAHAAPDALVAKDAADSTQENGTNETTSRKGKG